MAKAPDNAIDALTDAVEALAKEVTVRAGNHSASVLKEYASAANELAEARAWLLAPRHSAAN